MAVQFEIIYVYVHVIKFNGAKGSEAAKIYRSRHPTILCMFLGFIVKIYVTYDYDCQERSDDVFDGAKRA